MLLVTQSFVLYATEWQINAGNFYYSPSLLEINAGDTVEWINDGGFHDVNGNYSTFTNELYDNPENFYVGPPTNSSVIGSYTFNVPGTYNYDCSVGSHAANGMVGVIIVIDSSSDISGCMDPNAITCDDEIDPLYFPECNTCSDDNPCENYYNSDATIDNGLCMYNDVPDSDEVTITLENDGLMIDWSDFSPPVSVDQYVLMRCADIDGDNDNDGEFEYEMCVMIIPPMPLYEEMDFIDDFSDTDEYGLDDIAAIKYTLSIGYPNNNYWGSAFGNYYYEPTEDDVLLGDLNFDGIINVIDVVSMVNGILSGNFDSEQLAVADMNSDGIVNVIDIVSLVNFILG
tara:strand:+ start:1002 stop:2030 length:1029 start_codon:yes stop_codon:yes gene_type:complete